MKMFARSMACAALLSAGSAQAVTITFESVPNTTSYSEAGATITAAGQTFSSVGSPNGTNGLLSQGAPRAEFTAVFAGTTGFVSIDLGDFNIDPDLIFLEVFDNTSTMLGSTSLLLDSADTTMHTLSLSFAGIASARFGSRAPSVNGSSVYADNLSFRLEQGAVPEPSAWALLILGFGLVGGSLRARKRTVVFA